MLKKLQRKNKDKKKRINFEKTEMKRRYYKYMRIKAKAKGNVKSYAKYQSKLFSLPKVLITNYCYLTGRGRGVTRDFRLSRHQIKDKFKYLHGLKNSSW